MTNHESRLGQTGTRLCEISEDVREILADGAVSGPEVGRLWQHMVELEDLADEVVDVDLDIAQACQTLRLGRQRAPDRHLRHKIVILAEERERRKAPTRDQRIGAKGPTSQPRGR